MPSSNNSQTPPTTPAQAQAPTTPAPAPVVESPNASPAPISDELTPEAQLAQVSALLRGGDQVVPDGAPAPEGAPDPLSIEGLAAHLGRDPAELYQIKVGMRDGEVVTLGELKDYKAQGAEHSLAALEWESQRQAEQAELHRARAELAELIQAVPRERLNADALAKARAAFDGRMAIEKERTLARIPEWRDESRRTADVAGITEYLADYGLPPSALNEISDHRILLVIRDAWLRKSRLDAALAQVRTVRTNATPGSQRTPRPANSGSSRQGQRNPAQARLGEISKLLHGD